MKFKCYICKKKAPEYEGFNFPHFQITFDEANEQNEYILCNECFDKLKKIVERKRTHKGL